MHPITPECHMVSNEAYFFIQIEQTTCDEAKENVLSSPILHTSLSPDGELDELTVITMPVTLQEDKTKLTDLSQCHIRTFACDNSQKWPEITSELPTPAKLVNGVVSFQVRRFTK